MFSCEYTTRFDQSSINLVSSTRVQEELEKRTAPEVRKEKKKKRRNFDVHVCSGGFAS